jgi:hypothetical protein
MTRLVVREQDGRSTACSLPDLMARIMRGDIPAYAVDAYGVVWVEYGVPVRGGRLGGVEAWAMLEQAAASVA